MAGLITTQSSLQAINAVHGTPGQGEDLASLLGNLQNQFSTLLNDPGNATQQTRVVSTAATVAQQVNVLSDTYTAQRQAAEDAINTETGTPNSALGSIGALSEQIMKVKAAGQSTADLENQRDAQVSTVSQLLDVKVLEQPNGDMVITTATGTELPSHGAANPLSTTDVAVQPTSVYPSAGSNPTIPPIMLGGTDITGQLKGGQLGANITLRDTTLPTYQAELDEFAHNLAVQFAAHGLPLFTNSTGSVPPVGGSPVQSGYVGFAAVIQVNPAALANPSAVRDGLPSANGSGLARLRDRDRQRSQQGPRRRTTHVYQHAEPRPERHA